MQEETRQKRGAGTYVMSKETEAGGLLTSSREAGGCHPEPCLNEIKLKVKSNKEPGFPRCKRLLENLPSKIRLSIVKTGLSSLTRYKEFFRNLLNNQASEPTNMAYSFLLRHLSKIPKESTRMCVCIVGHLYRHVRCHRCLPVQCPAPKAPLSLHLP